MYISGARKHALNNSFGQALDNSFRQALDIHNVKTESSGVVIVKVLCMAFKTIQLFLLLTVINKHFKKFKTCPIKPLLESETIIRSVAYYEATKVTALVKNR